ncbi:hypothetical protein F5X99DRAFT_411891 [Biscogniauxia marginata]|nr:hypothetical protein F5X99DRAFT_411891 [Biscogniauxia marginata]
MFPTLVRRLATSSPVPPKLRSATKAPLVGIYNGRFKPKKVWPPDFSKLSEKEQFRFERRYKRRSKLATARPRWNRFIQLTQLFSVSFVMIYTVLFMEWDSETKPFEGIRSRFWGGLDALSQEKRHERRESE